MIAALALLLALGGGPGSATAADRESVGAPGAIQYAQAKPADDDVNDPLETMNRAIFDFNEFFYDLLLRPLSNLYLLLPADAREAIGNALDNLRSPVILANDLLQFEMERAGTTLGRAVVNSTVGLGGFFDVAKRLGWEKHKEDFGQTLAVWGVGEGFYLVVPVLGPSSPRDAIGKYGVDQFFDPLGFWDVIDGEELLFIRSGAAGVHEFSTVTEELDNVKKTSIDYYAAIRSLYRQKRQTEISNGRDVKLPPIPDLDLSLEGDGQAPALGAQPKPGGTPAKAREQSQLDSWRLRTRRAASEPQYAFNPSAPRFDPAIGPGAQR
jgi:phospholipid-binding lipoprotein MlaA